VVVHPRAPDLLGRRIVLDHSPTRVGRASDNDIVLDGFSVGRRHAHFEQRGDAWLVTWKLGFSPQFGLSFADCGPTRALSIRTTCAGTPIAVAPSGMSFITSELAAIFTLDPMRTPPTTVDPAPM
jgi:FHA domain